MPSTLDAVLRMRSPVFPCDANKRPMTPNGFKDATRDPETLRRWFSGDALIGIPTGAASGIVCVDVDQHGPTSGMPWWEAHRGKLGDTRRHRTRSGGLHLLFRAPADATIRNSASKLAPGVDVRGEGGYIIVPPSPGYTVDHMAPMLPMPPWLVAACLPPPRKAVPPATYAPREGEAWRRLMQAASRVADAKDGTRNDTLNAQAFHVAGLVGQGVTSSEAVAVLYQAAQRAGLAELEIKATLHSAFRAGGVG